MNIQKARGMNKINVPNIAKEVLVIEYTIKLIQIDR
jgi:hypothetical protein